MPRGRKQLSEAEMAALAAYADDKVHEIWGFDDAAQAGVETPPTLAQIAAIARLGTALNQLAGSLLTHAQQAERLAEIESKMRAAAQ